MIHNDWQILVFVVQLQTLQEISHQKNNFAELNQWTRCNYHNVARNKSVLSYILFCLVSKLSLFARSHVRYFMMVRRRHVSPANSMTKLRKPTCKSVYRKKKINKLFAGLGSVRMVNIRTNPLYGPSSWQITYMYCSYLPNRSVGSRSTVCFMCANMKPTHTCSLTSSSRFIIKSICHTQI